MHNFTSNDLLLYIFNEASPGQVNFIEKAIETEPELRNEYLNLQQTLIDIENFRMTPDDKIIEHIMKQFSHEKDVHLF
jgi:hypothetical protein